ncbi:TRAP transporter substrate-binding protein [Aureimonas altamirensis]|uniref:TRAP transporter substrate-binding protein n=1 Tax=Aureimonas altamirensis TaxID=370622 RepID=UPI001E300AD2|nr:TRAP transporter substrate-binding protein [Aureimonas altamirensis]UHD46392.1 TRAP transporter substrate-binding protein [Aureimonas altamirensis]
MIFGRMAMPVLAGISTLLAVSAALAQTITLQAATIAPPDNIWSKVGDRYAERVAERTNGDVVIQMSYAGAMGSAEETIEALQFGTTNIVIQEVGYIDGYDPLAGLGSYPYLIRDYEHFQSVMKDGGVGQAFHDALEERAGFKLIGAGFRGPREMATNRRIERPEDLTGLKMRVPNQQIFRQTWAMLGANPTPMPSLEVYTALQQGIIDGAENPLEAQIRSRYYEAIPYVIMTGHVNAYYTFIYDSASFAGLPEDVQTILIEEGEEAMRWGSEEMQKLLENYEEVLTRNGVEIIQPDVDAFRAKLEPLKDEFPAEFQDWIERFQTAG